MTRVPHPGWVALAQHRPMSLLGDLALFLGGSDDSFTGDLLRLIAKADPGNRARIARAFPAEARAWLAWQAIDVPTFARMAEVLAGSDPDCPACGVDGTSMLINPSCDCERRCAWPACHGGAVGKRQEPGGASGSGG